MLFNLSVRGQCSIIVSERAHCQELCITSLFLNMSFIHRYVIKFQYNGAKNHKHVTAMFINETVQQMCSSSAVINTKTWLSFSVTHLNNSLQDELKRICCTSYANQFLRPSKNIHCFLVHWLDSVSIQNTPTNNMLTNQLLNRMMEDLSLKKSSTFWEQH